MNRALSAALPNWHQVDGVLKEARRDERVLSRVMVMNFVDGYEPGSAFGPNVGRTDSVNEVLIAMGYASEKENAQESALEIAADRFDDRMVATRDGK